MKRLSILAILIGMALSASAQMVSVNNKRTKTKDSSDDGRRIEFGLRAGLTYGLPNSHCQLNPYNDFQGQISGTTGFTVGATADFPFNDTFGVNTGLFWTQHNLKANTVKNHSEKMETVTANYLQVPLMLNCRLALSDALSMQMGLGMYFAYGFSGEFYCQQTDYGNDCLDYCNTFDTLDDLDYGPTIALDFILFEHYRIGLQYEYGIPGRTPDRYKDDLNHGGINLTLGYTF